LKYIYISIFLFSTLFSSVLYANDKQLILAEGNDWLPILPDNLIKNHSKIESLPFSGFVMSGNSYTNKVMKNSETLIYKNVWNEVKGLKNLYKKKQHNFMQINVNFPSDFWDDKAWDIVTNNFAIVARASKELGFKGIVFDDEPYSPSAMKMVNYKFPNRDEISKNPKKYQKWQKRGSEDSWVDEDAYNNPKYTFKEHMTKVSSRFKSIMEAMEKSFPNLTLLVYNGPSYAHVNSNKENIIVTDVGLAREHEYKGAMFMGLKQGLNKTSSLHDMGESYRYRKDIHFQNAYQWRKYNIAKNRYNDLNSSYEWKIPKEERASWSTDVNVGFMVFNKGLKSNYNIYDTRKSSRMINIKETLKKALKYSDKYVIYYCHEQDWLLPNKKYPLKKGWMEMMREVYRDIE
jgi:hypothetical protein